MLWRRRFAKPVRSPDFKARFLNTTSEQSGHSTIPAPGEFIWCSIFSSRLTDGNQSIIVRLESWPEKKKLQSLAGFLGNTETTFFVLKADRIEIRWFAGNHEVPLCGHCALAVSSVLQPLLKDGELREVANLRGRLWLSRKGNKPYIVFRKACLREVPAERFQVGITVQKGFDTGRDYLLILKDEQGVKDFDPGKAGIDRLDKIGCIISSSCTSATAAFRFFAPRAGIQEDRASGSVVPALMEYWAREKPGEHIFNQESRHGVQIRAQWLDGKVALSGEVLRFARGKIAPQWLENSEL
jgi:predicted PhzF superfamily epimerase YddE/YHI9